MVTTSGGARRRASGATGLTMKPASRASAATAGAMLVGQGDRAQEAGAPDAGDLRVAEREDPPLRGARRPRRAWSSSPSDAMVSSTASPAAQASGLPPKVEPCMPGGEHRAHRRAEGHEGTDRHAAAEALGQGHRVGHDAGLLEGEPRAGAADAGLHLVEDEQRPDLAGDLAGRAQVGRATGPHARLALDRLEDQGGGLLGHGGSQGVDVAPRHVADPGDERLERLAVGRLVGQREGTRGAAVEGALGGDDARCDRCAGRA